MLATRENIQWLVKSQFNHKFVETRRIEIPHLRYSCVYTKDEFIDMLIRIGETDPMKELPTLLKRKLNYLIEIHNE